MANGSVASTLLDRINREGKGGDYGIWQELTFTYNFRCREKSMVRLGSGSAFLLQPIAITSGSNIWTGGMDTGTGFVHKPPYRHLS